MSRRRLPLAASCRVTALITGVLVSACGLPAEQPGPEDPAAEFTFVAVHQYNTPVLLTASDEPAVYRVTADVTLAFRFADRLETLIVDLKGPVSGRSIHHEFDLAALAPEIASATEGRWEVRVPLLLPELGSLLFRMTLVDHAGAATGTIEGGFTVQSVLGAGNTTQTTQGNGTTEFPTP